MSLKPSTIIKIGVAIIVAALVVSAIVLWAPGGEQRRVTGYFDNAVGLYPGADVRILGIKVGEVDSVTPAGQQVRIEMSYDAKRKVPSDAQAVIVSQSLVSDRYIQLTPVYKGGPVMADGKVLTREHTAIPVEVDQVAGNLNDLNKALGPDGANANGSLSRLLAVGADTLEGQGGDIRQTISDTSRMLSTLSEDSDDVAKTIQNLRTITAAMKANDQQIRRFTENLSGVSGQLASEKDELSAALRTLGPTLQNVTRFVKDNRSDLAASVRQLAQITGVLVKNKKALQEFITVAPLGVNNVARAYDPISGTIGTRANLENTNDMAAWFCSLAYGVDPKMSPAQCEKTLAPLNPIGKGLHLSLDLSWITAMTTHYDPVPIPPDAYGPNGKAGKSGKSGKAGASGSGAKTAGTPATGTGGSGATGGTGGLTTLLPELGGTR